MDVPPPRPPVLLSLITLSGQGVEGEEVLPLAGFLSPLSRMPGRLTRRRTASQTRANKKHANNVAKVLKKRISNMMKRVKRKTRKLTQRERKRQERAAENAVAEYMRENPGEFFNMNNGRNQENYGANEEEIMDSMPSSGLSMSREKLFEQQIKNIRNAEARITNRY